MNKQLQKYIDSIPFRTVESKHALGYLNGKATCKETFEAEGMIIYAESEYKVETFNRSRKEYYEKTTPGEEGTYYKAVKDMYMNVYLHGRDSYITLTVEDFERYFAVPAVKSLKDALPGLHGYYKSLVSQMYAEYGLKSFDFQAEDIASLCMKSGGVLAWEQGLGKSLGALIYAKIKKRLNNYKKVLFVAPQDLIDQWIESGERVEASIKRIASFTDVQSARMAKDGYYITHFEFLANRQAYKRLKSVFDIVIVDEATKIKGGDSLRGTAVRALKADCKVALSGTPIKNLIPDYPALAGWLWGYDSRLYPYSYSQEDKFLQDYGTLECCLTTRSGNKSTKLLPEINNLPFLHRLTAPTVLRRTKNELKQQGIKFVDKKVWECPVDFSGYEKMDYDSIKSKDTMTQIWEQKRFASLCSQEKTEAMKRVVDSVLGYEEQVIIFTGIQAQAEKLKKIFGNKAEIANGTVSARDRSEVVIPNFKKNKFPILIAGFEAMGVGHDLYNCNNCIIMDYTWEHSTLDQAIDRSHRLSSQKDINIFFLYVRNTVEERLIKLINSKRTAAKSVIDYV